MFVTGVVEAFWLILWTRNEDNISIKAETLATDGGAERKADKNQLSIFHQMDGTTDSSISIVAPFGRT